MDILIIDGSEVPDLEAWGVSVPVLRLVSIVDPPSPIAGAALTKPISPARLFDALRRCLEPGAGTSQAVVVRPARPRTVVAENLAVLLAEDNPINQAVAEATLEELGLTVDIVDNGAAAVDAVQRRPYDLVLMDVQMPELDGLEATRRIRADRNLHQPFIVAVTANATVQDRQLCFAAGMDDYIRKPFQLEDLRASLSRRVDRSVGGEDAGASGAGSAVVEGRGGDEPFPS